MLVVIVTDESDAQVAVPDFITPLPVIRMYAPSRDYQMGIPSRDSITLSWGADDPREWKRAECRGGMWTHLTPGQAAACAPEGSEVPYIDAYSLTHAHGPETVPEEWCSCGWYGKFYPWPSRTTTVPRDMGTWTRYYHEAFSSAASAYIMEVKGEVMVHDSGVRAEYARLTHRITVPSDDADHRVKYWEDVVGDKVILPKHVDVPRISIEKAAEMLAVWPEILKG